MLLFNYHIILLLQSFLITMLLAFLKIILNFMMYYY